MALDGPKTLDDLLFSLKALVRTNNFDVLKDELKKAIPKGFNLNRLGCDGEPLIFTSIRYNCKKITTWLLENGADVNKKSSNDIPPLHIAVKNDLKNMVKLLVQNGANVHELDNDGWCALDHAIDRRNYQMVEELLLSGADPNYYEHTTQFAANKESFEILSLLFRFGADLNPLKKIRNKMLWKEVRSIYDAASAENEKEKQNLSLLDIELISNKLPEVIIELILSYSDTYHFKAFPNYYDRRQRSLFLHICQSRNSELALSIAKLTNSKINNIVFLFLARRYGSQDLFLSSEAIHQILIHNISNLNMTLNYLFGLSNNPEHKPNIDSFMQDIAHCPMIKELSLNRSFSVERCFNGSFVTFLSNPSHLESFDLSRDPNSINDMELKHIKILAKALRQNRSLKKLDLSHQPVKNDGLTYIFNALKENSGSALKKLILNDCGLNDEVAKLIITHLKTFPSLQIECEGNTFSLENRKEIDELNMKLSKQIAALEQQLAQLNCSDSDSVGDSSAGVAYLPLLGKKSDQKVMLLEVPSSASMKPLEKRKSVKS